MEASVHSGALAQISGNRICFVAWARAFHAATLLKDQCGVGISCEVAGCSQISTPGLTFSVQAYIMSNRSLLIICNVKTVLCMFCRSVRSWLQHMRVTKFRQLHTNILSLLVLFRCMVATVLCYLKKHIIHNFCKQLFTCAARHLLRKLSNQKWNFLEGKKNNCMLNAFNL